MSRSRRRFDVVVLGATGYTGQLVAHYLAQRSGMSSVRWAIAGRNAKTLADVRDACAILNSEHVSLPILTINVSNTSSLDELARSTSVVINCAGPFAVTGEPVIGACIRHGAHYLDLTGEWPYWDTIVRKYDAAARKAGVAVVPACGLDCIPSDLAVFHALSSGPSGVVSDASSVEFFFDMDVKPSAGTVKSIIGIIKSLSLSSNLGTLAAWYGPLSLSSIKGAVQSVMNAGTTMPRALPLPHYNADCGGWALPFFGLETRVIRRSSERLHVQDDEYPVGFSLGQYVVVRKHAWLAVPLYLLAMFVLLPLFYVFLRTVPFAERIACAAVDFAIADGGPTLAQREAATFAVNAVVRDATGKVRARSVAKCDTDPGYGSTAKWIAEIGLMLAADAASDSGAAVADADEEEVEEAEVAAPGQKPVTHKQKRLQRKQKKGTEGKHAHAGEDGVLPLSERAGVTTTACVGGKRLFSRLPNLSVSTASA